MPHRSEPRFLVSPIRHPAKDDGDVRVIIETPKGSRNKFAFDPELAGFALTKVLPAGMAFPYHYGFVPSTRADDGDPIDVLVLMDEPAFPGCILRCRLIGIISGSQRTKKGRVENDRLLAIERNNHSLTSIKTLDDLGGHFLKGLESFFVDYHELDGEKYKVTGTGGPKAAEKALRAARRRAKRRSS